MLCEVMHVTFCDSFVKNGFSASRMTCTHALFPFHTIAWGRNLRLHAHGSGSILDLSRLDPIHTGPIWTLRIWIRSKVARMWKETSFCVQESLVYSNKNKWRQRLAPPNNSPRMFIAVLLTVLYNHFLISFNNVQSFSVLAGFAVGM